MFTNGFTAYVSPTQVYLLAAVFRIFPPSILLARVFSAFWVFAACLLLGLLAKRISGQLKIGVIVAATALLTPWFFDLRGLVMEVHFCSTGLGAGLVSGVLRAGIRRLGLAFRCSSRGDACALDLLLYERPRARRVAGSWSPTLCNNVETPDWHHCDVVVVRLIVDSDISIQSPAPNSFT